MPRSIELMSLDTLQRAPRNPKAHNAQGLKESLSRFGYVEPIVVDERTDRIVAGHGRLEDLEARLAAGEDPPEGVEVAADGAWQVPVLRGWSSTDDREAEAYVLASNRIGEMGGWDDRALADLLGDYVGDVDWLTGTGYDAASVDALLQARARSDEPPEAFGEFGEDIDVEHQCPKCGYTWSGSSAVATGANAPDDE